jgi:Transcriptional regulatory protein, C terminal
MSCAYGGLIRGEGHRLSEMVEQILRFAGIQVGQARYDPRPVDVAGVIERAGAGLGLSLVKRLVEDEPGLVLTLTDRLESEGFTLRLKTENGTTTYLIDHRGDTLSREELLTEVWKYDAMPSTRTVDVHVAWLRQKLEDNPKVPQLILTIRGLGYKFTG